MWTLKQLKDIFRKGDFKDSAVVVWPVVYPAGYLPPKEPHVTILYLPDVTSVSKELVLEAIKATGHEVYLVARAEGIEMFGPDKDIPVVRVQHNYFEDYYRQLREEFDKRGIEYSTLYDYSPHVTMSEEAGRENLYPQKFNLLPVQLWWRNEKIRIFSGR